MVKFIHAPKPSDTIKVVRDNKIVSDKLCSQAEQIRENVKLPYDDSISEQGAEDAIRTAEQILKEAEEKP